MILPEYLAPVINNCIDPCSNFAPLSEQIFSYHGLHYMINTDTNMFGMRDFYFPRVGVYDVDNKLLALENSYARLEDIERETVRNTEYCTYTTIV